MKFTAAQIAVILEGEVEGNPEIEVSKLSKIEEGGPESLSFLANPKYTQFIYTTKASIVIVNKIFKAEKEINSTLIRVEDAYKSFSKLLEYYNQVKMNKTGIENPVFISKSAIYGENIYIGAFAYLGENIKIGNNTKIYPNVYIGDNVTIGDNVILFSGAKIYSDTIIGDNCVIHSSAILGADGFGFAPNEKGEFIMKIKKEHMIHDYLYSTHPFDVVGCDGYNFPYAFSIHDFEPITGRVHQPPPVHQTFETSRFVLCSFCPRLYDYHPEAIPAPYNHSNIDSDEVLYYVDGDFMSRNHVQEGYISLHPAGIPHGPHPGAMERSIGKKKTDELAVMVDTFAPLKLTQLAVDLSDGKYHKSWIE